MNIDQDFNRRANNLKLVLVIAFLVLFFASYLTVLAAGSNLTWGSSGQAVTEVQQKLKNWGYMDGAADGVYGVKTYNAVVKFQKKNGLTADGIVGQATYKALGLTKYVDYGSSGNSGSAGGTAGGAAGSGGGSPDKDAVSTSDDVDLLAKAIYAEAEGEPYTGQVAVGAVLLNRVASPDFPNTLSGVIYQGKALESVSNGRFNASQAESCRKAAQDALNGWDPTYGCLYFWNPYKPVTPWIWTRQIVVQYGDHVFGK